jgi:hypothetical protein
MDVQVPLAITRGLRRRGIDVLTAQQDGAGRLPDPELLNRARTLERILFSQDEDLVVEAVRRQRANEDFATVVYAPQLDLSIGRCIADLEVLAKVGKREDLCGQIIFI